MTRVLVLLTQIVLAAALPPIVLKHGVLNLINLVASNNLNQRLYLQLIVAQAGTYMVALLVALVFWLVGRVAARLFGSSRIPSFATLLATIVLALGFAHLSQLPFAASLNTAVYAMFYRDVPTILYPLLGAVLAAWLLPGKMRAI